MAAWVGVYGRSRARYLDTYKARNERKAAKTLAGRLVSLAKFEHAKEDAAKRHEEHLASVRASKTLPARMGKVWGKLKGFASKAFGRGK